MSVDGIATWRDIVLPKPDGTGGYLRADVRFRRTPGVVTLEARTGHGGWRMTAHSRSADHSVVVAGIYRATVRVEDDLSLEVSWPDGLPPGVPVAAIVSDVPTFARSGSLQRTVAALYGFLPTLGGRPAGSTNKLRDALVAELRANPTMTNGDIDRRGVEMGIWTPAPGDYDVIGKRVHRLRKSANTQ